MKRFIYNILLCLILIAGNACSEMNDVHDKYLREGETIYIGKIDSVKLYPGNERMLVQYWITDPRAKELEVSWLSKEEPLILDIPTHHPEDTLEFMIEAIPEGDHELMFITNDKEGNSSVILEALQSVFGPIYKGTLTNRPVKQTTVTNDGLSILWGGSLNAQEIGIEISYVTAGGKNKSFTLESDLLKDPVILDNVDLSKPVQYQTLYLPSPEAIDTFSTEMARVTIKQRLNVALNKTVTTSTNLNDSYTGKNVVDGVINQNASRWVTDASNAAQWIEIDLGKTYAVDGFKTYTGSNGSFGYPTLNFEFQAEVDGEWETIIAVTENSDAQYNTNFKEVNTSKVRYFIPPYSNNQVRLYELEVYATIEY